MAIRAVEVLRPSELRDDQWNDWASVQVRNSHFDSAFYAPELARIVSTVRDDVEVAVMREAASR